MPTTSASPRSSRSSRGSAIARAARRAPACETTSSAECRSSIAGLTQTTASRAIASPAQAPDQLLALAAEHRAAHDLDPPETAGVLRRCDVRGLVGRRDRHARWTISRRADGSRRFQAMPSAGRYRACERRSRYTRRSRRAPASRAPPTALAGPPARPARAPADGRCSGSRCDRRGRRLDRGAPRAPRPPDPRPAPGRGARGAWPGFGRGVRRRARREPADGSPDRRAAGGAGHRATSRSLPHAVRPLGHSLLRPEAHGARHRARLSVRARSGRTRAQAVDPDRRGSGRATRRDLRATDGSPRRGRPDGVQLDGCGGVPRDDGVGSARGRASRTRRRADASRSIRARRARPRRVRLARVDPAPGGRARRNRRRVAGAARPVGTEHAGDVVPAVQRLLCRQRRFQGGGDRRRRHPTAWASRARDARAARDLRPRPADVHDPRPGVRRGERDRRPDRPPLGRRLPGATGSR